MQGGGAPRFCPTLTKGIINLPPLFQLTSNHEGGGCLTLLEIICPPLSYLISSSVMYVIDV